ncbi:MAG: hypothetical protein HGB11_02230 [Chlorobiales bacterium]|nr:hypothetical protein [Chlorobiales bacterium]
MMAVAFKPLHAQIAGAAAPYARMGFSARGIALGNAGTAVMLDGELHPYYNPALLGFAEFYTGITSYSYMPLDRKLNFVSITGKIGPDAGIGFSWINSGVSDIDGRDSDGNSTGMFSTSENLFMLSFANRFDENLSLGINMRGYLANLYKGVSNSFSVGFDLGAAYRFTPDSLSTISFGVVLADIASKYEWDTTPIYNEQGSLTTDKLPLSIRVGTAYSREGLFGFKLVMLAASIEVQSMTFEGRRKVVTIQNGIPVDSYETESIKKSEAYLKLGLMLQPVRILKLRFGIDRLGVQGIDFTEVARPAVGFSIEYPMQAVLTLIDYAYVFEPYAPAGMSVISVGARF